MQTVSLASLVPCKKRIANQRLLLKVVLLRRIYTKQFSKAIPLKKSHSSFKTLQEGDIVQY
jgi:hypothetical protein